MIEVQFIRCTTHPALATITFPDGELNRCGNHPPTLNIRLRPNGELLVTLNSDKSEFEDLSEFIFFAP